LVIVVVVVLVVVISRRPAVCPEGITGIIVGTEVLLDDHVNRFLITISVP
jgi:hypothetical protein